MQVCSTEALLPLVSAYLTVGEHHPCPPAPGDIGLFVPKLVYWSLWPSLTSLLPWNSVSCSYPVTGKG